jgi:hypothetical protein
MSFKLANAATNLGVQKKTPKMQFMLTGFKQDIEFRVFNFETSPVGAPKVQFSVRADLALARRYGIQMQALPLLCWELLERNENSLPENIGAESTMERSFTYSEEEMCRYARTCKEERAAIALKKQSARKTLTATQPGVGWRTAAPLAHG